MSLYGKIKKNAGLIKTFLKSSAFQRILIGVLTITAVFAIIENGAIPKKYRLNLGDKSPYDITAPRDIVNKIKTEENARAKAEAVPAVMKRLDNVPIDVLNHFDDFLTIVEAGRKSKDNSRQEQENPVAALVNEINEIGISLSDEQAEYLLKKVTDEELTDFKRVIRGLISSIMKDDVNSENIALKAAFADNRLKWENIGQELKNVGSLLIKSLLKPNSIVDEELTEAKRNEVYKNAKEDTVKILDGTRILSVGDIVTEDKLEVLRELNLLETSKFDYVFALGILAILLLMAFMLIMYMNHFCRRILESRNDIIILSVIIVLTLLLARVVRVFSPLLIPIFIASMLISILLDVKLAVMVNFLLALAISLAGRDDKFLYMAMISGTFSAFIATKTNQRSKLSTAGLLIAGLNILVITGMDIINKSDIRTIASECLVVSINGIASTVLTIGLLPFFESTFNVITPLKLLELANPNQPLIKRLLLEAPGTYHHSLMVGNLSEVATEAINGNALLARVGAYYHDIGKLRRPNFFTENQLADNPHDKMTANLSTLVITSHTHDGIELAEQYKLPAVIKDIIIQHHGTTMVAYFYHKAKKSDKTDTIYQDDFRYSGPKPMSKEAAVVMLADSVEAAVRSTLDKTEGKIEGLIRKIIKDKLDDEQLDLCELTLKDLDNIAKGFMRVLSGFFHEREEYPDIRLQDDMKIKQISDMGDDTRGDTKLEVGS